MNENFFKYDILYDRPHAKFVCVYDMNSKIFFNFVSLAVFLTVYVLETILLCFTVRACIAVKVTPKRPYPATSNMGGFEIIVKF